MCGIVGYTGKKQAASILLEGLEKLEYRGYDSAGLAIAGKDGIQIVKSQGRLKVLAEKTKDGTTMKGTSGIGHTRWATHGEPSDVNSHPHTSRGEQVAIVHNGIIENYMVIKEFLQSFGYSFASETDTEVLAHLLDFLYKGDPIDAILETIERVEGSYALGILFADHPGEIYAVRKDSPLIVGLGKDENFIASDIPAILKHTRKTVLIGEREIAKLTPEKVEFFDILRQPIEKEIFEVEWDAESAEKGGYEHFMAKEIDEQPEAIRKTISPRIKNGKVVLDDFKMTAEEFAILDNIYIVACGSAYHVGFAGKYILEKKVRVPVNVDLASEFRYRDPIVTDKSLVIIISQSGETLDTLCALREAKKKGARILSIVNVVGSSIARESDDVIYTWAGPEIAVATTKAYSTQLAVVYLLAEYFRSLKENHPIRSADTPPMEGNDEDGMQSVDEVEGRARNDEQAEFIENHPVCCADTPPEEGNLRNDEGAKFIEEIMDLPNKVQKVLDNKEELQQLAALFFDRKDIFFLGRGVDYAVALEGSLKLKEISYIHSEAYAAGELKHGPISLIELGTLVVALATEDALFDKVMSNVREVKARGATVIAIVCEDKKEAEKFADYVVYVPKTKVHFMPSVTVLPLQIFSYYMAVARGVDVDKPRNLAKSVTVE